MEFYISVTGKYPQHVFPPNCHHMSFDQTEARENLCVCCVCVLDICSYSNKTPPLRIKMTKKKLLDVSLDANLTMNFSSNDLKQCAQDYLLTLFNQSASGTGMTHSVDDWVYATK